MSKNNGGPAFPATPEQMARGFEGLTVRQYYKSAAIQGFIASLGPDFDCNDGMKEERERIEREHQAAVAKWCAGYADAMIAEDEEAGE
jgi:hypothetical protein